MLFDVMRCDGEVGEIDEGVKISSFSTMMFVAGLPVKEVYSKEIPLTSSTFQAICTLLVSPFTSSNKPHKRLLPSARSITSLAPLTPDAH